MLRIITIFVFVISLFSPFNKIFQAAEKWLSIDKPVEAELLIVEAWVPDYLAGKVIDEFQSKNYKELLITGNTKFDCLSLWENGSIFISPAWEQFTSGSVCEVCILTKGTPVKKQYPVVEIYQDSVKIGDLIAGPRIEWHCKNVVSLTEHTTLEYRFINDRVSGQEDRNFFFYYIKLNDSLVRFTSDIVSLTNNNLYNVLAANYFSDASMKAMILKNAGIPADCISFTKAEKTAISRTLSSAAAALQYMQEHGYCSANIFTTDYHSRRSYKSYIKLAGNKVRIGIISEPLNNHIRKRIIIKEYVKIIALSFIPRFYIYRKFRKLGLIPSELKRN